MLQLQDLPMLFEKGRAVVALETPLTERIKVLNFLSKLATTWRIPLYFWNSGYSQLQKVDEYIRFVPTDAECTSGLVWLLQHLNAPGIFVFEAAISPDAVTGLFPPQTTAMLSNLVYDLAANTRQQLLICCETYIELPLLLVPLVPILTYPFPDAIAVREIVMEILESRVELNRNSDRQFETLIRTCLGLPIGELEILFSQLSGFVHTLEELNDAVLAYKNSKFLHQGIEFISEPDVPQTGGLDLLEEILERAAVLLKPEARVHNLQFPKGIILWGPPGTGKSLSAKLAAKKMGVPMVAVDWAGLRGATAYESRKNLREFLQFCDANGEYGLVLYFDDFDKGFAGFDSDSDGGISRQLAGKLLTWMQERTSQVLVMATVNRLEFLPPELVRRFDEIIFVDLPHAGARYEIFKLHLAKYFPGLDFSEKDWLRLLRETNLLTPAEIAMIVRKTAQEAFYRNTQEFSTCELGKKPLSVTVKDFLEQRYNFTPSMIREEDKIIEIRNKAVYARPATSPDKSRWAKEPEVLFGS
ncbi:ATP-binding protein [Tolypothrix sp. PCC 7910]|uniref:ATP-binding protein n=1 Tax=Tolypothrix sp. PCC 7910 TaxID=2099387 RepID=UPI001FCC5DA7|nr:ATP-binding protein [Tolypothrix sp. PCC 7910]